MTRKNLEAELKKLGDPVKAKFVAGYFKTGKGEYGEGDKFLGITVPLQRKVAKKYKDLSLADTQQLLRSPIHEFRQTALLILTDKYEAADPIIQKKIVSLCLKNTKYINNWDLVDTAAPYILGEFLFEKYKSILYKLAKSKNIWERRLAIIATAAFIKRGSFADTLKISEMLLKDSHDLIHKAVGWMLREVGNKNMQVEKDFLDKHSAQMPSVMLRYAIEKMDPPTRQKYLQSRKKK